MPGMTAKEALAVFGVVFMGVLWREQNIIGF